jgi:4-hydroxy-2-oxoheptanedioate aldolase
MRKNKAKAKLLAGEPIVGFVFYGAWPEAVEMAGLLGADFVWFDAEHTATSLCEIPNLVRAAEGADVTPIARVSQNHPGLILRYLDAGIQGIVMPMVSSREDAERLVSAVKYYPEGMRGCGHGHPMDYWIKQPFVEYMKEANRETLVVTLVETKSGIENLEDIIKVPGVDVVLIGPLDLSSSLGVPTQFDHPLMKQAIARAKEVVLRSEKKLGLGGWNARQLIQEGIRFVPMDVQDLLIKGMKDYLKTARGEN